MAHARRPNSVEVDRQHVVVAVAGDGEATGPDLQAHVGRPCGELAR